MYYITSQLCQRRRNKEYLLGPSFYLPFCKWKFTTGAEKYSNKDMNNDDNDKENGRLL